MAGVRVPSASQPMKFSAIDTPMEAPTPALPPPPSATAAAAMVALMAARLVASTVTSAARNVLLSTAATVDVRMTLVARAPAPLTATPAVAPNPAAIEAAAARAVMVPSASSHERVLA